MHRPLLNALVLFLFCGMCSFTGQAAQEGHSKSPTLEDSKSPTLEDIDRLQEMDKLQGMLKQMDKLGEEVDAKFRFQCLKALGNEKFCTCLKDNRPWIVDFVGYVTLVTSTREELNYTKLDREMKGVVDNTYRAREVCVRANMGK
jgi:hypothetical protein